MTRGDVYEVTSPTRRGRLQSRSAARAPAGRAPEPGSQSGPRYAVVVQASDLAPLSTVVGCPTSRSARATTFRPQVEVLEQPTRVLCEQVGALDVRWLGGRVGHLSLEEQRLVDDSLRLVLDL